MLIAVVIYQTNRKYTNLELTPGLSHNIRRCVDSSAHVLMLHVHERNGLVLVFAPWNYEHRIMTYLTCNKGCVKWCIAHVTNGIHLCTIHGEPITDRNNITNQH